MFYFHLTPCRSNHTEGLKGPHWGPQKRSPPSIPCSISPSSWTNVKALKCNLVNVFFTEWSMNVLKTTDWTFWLIACGKLLLCYRSSLRQYHLVHMRRVRVRRCRCCWCRVALWTGYAGSHLPVILSAWHLHLYGSLFAPVVDLLDVTSSLRGTKLWHVTLLRLCMFKSYFCSFSEDFLYSHFFFAVYKTLLLFLSLPVLRTLPAVRSAVSLLFIYHISGAECCPQGGTVCDGYLDHTGWVLCTNELLYVTALRCLTFFVWT